MRADPERPRLEVYVMTRLCEDVLLERAAATDLLVTRESVMRSMLRVNLVGSVLAVFACSAETERSSSVSDADLDTSVGALEGANGISATLSITTAYIGGYCGRVTVVNRGSSSTSSWTTALQLGTERLTWLEGATANTSGGVTNVSSISSNAAIAVGSSTQYRFCASGTYRDPLVVTGVSAEFQGAGGSGGSSGGGSGGSSSGGSTSGPTGGTTSSGPTPQLPAITGTCPTFTTGTATIGGLSGISLQVGAKKQGTGSLLFYWHGTGSTASEVNSLVPASVRSDILAQGGIIVSFQRSLGTGGDCSGTSTFSKDDFKIADLIAACAVRDHGIDPRRIYTTGCSAGGLQAGCMGAMRSSYVAAVVPNSGGEVVRQTIQSTAHVPAVMTMHGGALDFVGVSFATTSATYDSHMKSAGSFVVNCNHGGGHCQAPAALYSAGWEFMKAHPFGVVPEPYAASLPASFPSYCDEY